MIFHEVPMPVRSALRWRVLGTLEILKRRIETGGLRALANSETKRYKVHWRVDE